MQGYPDGYLSARPRWTTVSGLADIVGFRLGLLGRRLSAVLLDMVAVGLLWILVTYAYMWYAHGVVAYTVIPWWLFGVLVFELALLWTSFDIPLSQKLSGLRLVQADGGAPRVRQRMAYFLLLHGSVLLLVGLLARQPWHERLSGLRARQLSSGGVKPLPWYRTSVGIYLALTLVAVLVAALGVTVSMANLRRLVSDAWRAGNIWRAFFTPDTTILQTIFRDLIVTFFMAVLATAFAVLAAVPLSFLSARNLMKGPVGRLTYTVLRGTMSITRSIEPIVWAIVFLVWVTARRAPFAGVLALIVHSIADLVKLYAEQLEGIDPGLPEAITATGGGRLAVLRFGVLPQIINPYISFTLYRWDINIRMATVVGVVGGGGIGQRLYSYLQGHMYSQAGTAMLLIVILVWAIDYLSGRLRAKLV